MIGFSGSQVGFRFPEENSQALAGIKDDALPGATIVAERAGEAITEFTLALQRGLKVGDLAGAILVYPTYSTAVPQLAAEVATDNFLSSLLGRMAQVLTRSG